ncbi:Protein of unknown function [Micrococcales bacterium KH10]|nr:Protein of unknown function [Micrococcales bacterium KH10]
MPFLIYSAWRLLLLFASAAGLYWAGMRGWLLWVVAVFVALLASYALLNSPRTRAAEYLAARRVRRDSGHRFTPQQEEDFADEDAAIDRETSANDGESEGPSEEPQ